MATKINIKKLEIEKQIINCKKAIKLLDNGLCVFNRDVLIKKTKDKLISSEKELKILLTKGELI